ncbi:formate dehydrogenase accessory sulfurtransferase FdhD [Methanocalculus taiwanensis]|uniref:Protein FdhD n=1 Tax=Methanocalculus taiwanensis TaxID=106207 RepID=A0ABD4TIW1_9EURY|nr:formate dehydrogenase accessory sulfurtransferase FdhD [Methanocalculus taiwanensis]MCQ1538636.1 formate dehydrogenase accessory sulfurtransferase FdhD [Methanocalculus taiwanensis]
MNDAFELKISSSRGKECDLTRDYPVLVFDGSRFVSDAVSICIEEQVRLFLNGEHCTTMVATPDELVEFAVGFIIDEGFLQGIHEIDSIRIDDLSIDIRTRSDAACINSHDLEVGSSGGAENAGRSDEEAPALPDGCVFPVDAVFSAVDRLHDLSNTWKKTGGTHSALILTMNGDLVAYAEDMGRHTAIDKAIGKALIKGTSLSTCSLTCSGRLPAGMIRKAYRVGIPLIISNNAPFSSGIDMANKLNITVAGFVRRPRAVIYSGMNRIRGSDSCL